MTEVFRFFPDDWMTKNDAIRMVLCHKIVYWLLNVFKQQPYIHRAKNLKKIVKNLL